MMRSRFLPVVALTIVGLMVTACSDGLRDAARTDAASRNAAAASSPSDSVNVDEFCSTFTRSGFFTAAEIATCFILDNQTRRFDRPGSLGSKFELYVPKAECGVRGNVGGDPCVATPKRYGEIRDHQNGSTYGARIPTPNPFLNVAAVQFQSAAMYAGTDEVVYVGSKQAPMSLEQLPAKAYFKNPYSTETSGSCEAQGQFLTCDLLSSSWSVRGDWQRPRYVFGTLPWQIQINNSSGRTMVQQSSPIAGPGFLIDPNGTSTDAQLASIPTGGTVYVGGYRSANSDAEQSWTANYVIQSLSGDVPVSISLKLAKVDNKWVSQSTCAVNNRSATTTFKCNKPEVNDSDSYRQATVSITDY